jgi:phosphoribosylaminoimidazolecarboxamide formyltransferase/IMP cyclohydrolase
MNRPRTALLSVSDKTGIVEFAAGLRELGYRILSSGGTARTLRQAEIEVCDVQEITGPNDLLAGRVRLLHPRLFAAILADPDDEAENRDLEAAGLSPIQIVAVNLFPLSEVILDGSLAQKDALDFLDTSGSALLRAASRNFKGVLALCDPNDYASALDALRSAGGLPLSKSRSLAAKAFYYVSYYDSTAAQHLDAKTERLPDELVIGLKKTLELPYGENPHQRAALYKLSGARPWGLNAASLVLGKRLNYNHYAGMDRACELVAEFSGCACAIVRHANPAGAALSARPADAARLAYASDPSGCTGGIAAFNRPVDEEAARALAPETLECILAPDFSAAALAILRRKKDVRLVTLPSLLLSPNEIDIRTVSGGLLIQDKDNATLPSEVRAVTRRVPGEVETASLLFAWKTVKHATTHAAVLARGQATLGIAGGQTTRMDALRQAFAKSRERHPILAPDPPVVLACDGPLGPAHIEEAAKSGVQALIQPGGTSDDPEAVRVCDERSLAMLFTGIRHYRH